MFKYLMIVAFIACAFADDDAHAQIETLTSDVRADGFEYKLDTTNGIHAESSGDEHGNVHGSYSFTAPKGELVEIQYVADENGYQPSGDLLPVGPAIPEAIQKGLDYISAHPPRD